MSSQAERACVILSGACAARAVEGRRKVHRSKAARRCSSLRGPRIIGFMKPVLRLRAFGAPLRMIRVGGASTAALRASAQHDTGRRCFDCGAARLRSA